MAEVIFVFADRQLLGASSYEARVLARPMGNVWEGWIEFIGADGRALQTPRETTQPHRQAMEYWASGLSPTYLEGAFVRAEAAEAADADGTSNRGAGTRFFDGGSGDGGPVLDPYSVAAKGEELLRSELFALSAWHLRNIVRAYELTDTDADLKSLTQPQLVELIVESVMVT